MISETLPWTHPLAVARALGKNEQCFVLLYSGQQLTHTGRYSYLALAPQENVAGSDFSLLALKLTHDAPLFDNAWFGYFGYEMLHSVESLPREEKGYISLPDLWFTRFGLILRFDHEAQSITCHREAHVALPGWGDAAPTPDDAPAVATLASPMTREAYLAIVNETRESIRRGDFYQANITRKFTGEFAAAPDALSLFVRLSEASPAAYSAFIRIGDKTILSSSPEQFLTVDAAGRMQSRPIKGTTPRFADAHADEASRTQLALSEKDRAENLMIVDLMRNDFSRSAEAGSVKAGPLFEVSSYATLHHMASTVTAQKRRHVSTLAAVNRAFPPGSMTGAPKVRAMQWCLEHEGIRRGIYSGALGWFGGNGSCDLSVVIRTLVIDGRRFEFQVGGGIVADSEADSEWRETMTKARGICAALGIDVGKLEKL